MEKSGLIAVVRQWVVKAEHDLEIVRRDIVSKEPLTDVLCFHYQAVEKYLKSFLVYHGIKPPRIHIIENILLECEKIDPSFSLLQPVSYLSEFAVELRYPDDFSLPPVAQMKKAFNDALFVRDFVRSKIKEI